MITMKEYKRIDFSVPDIGAAEFQPWPDKLTFNMPDLSEHVRNSLLLGQSVTQKLQPTLDHLASLQVDMAINELDTQSLSVVLQALNDKISQLAAAVSVPAFSDAEKAELLENYRQWGRYGWTAHPSAAPKCFYATPDNNKAAHKQMQMFLSKAYSERLFSLLRKNLNNTNDLESAIFCYNNRQYKACALLLFSMIDSEIIHFQTNVQRPDVGTRAIKYVKQKAEEYDEGAFIFVLHYANIISCLETLFESGHNFVKEPATINRNYICHGMSQRPVRKRDCYQLFLLLYNFQRYSKRWV